MESWIISYQVNLVTTHKTTAQSNYIGHTKIKHNKLINDAFNTTMPESTTRKQSVMLIRIKSISATKHIGHNHIGHTEDQIGHRQSPYRPQVDIGYRSTSATNV